MFYCKALWAGNWIGLEPRSLPESNDTDERTRYNLTTVEMLLQAFVSKEEDFIRLEGILRNVF